LSINSQTINSTKATYDIVKTMRASILVLGPLLARFKYCEVSLPGGCAIGARPVDLHLKALEKMGAQIEIKNGYIEAKAPNGLQGAHINFEKVTVTGTENILMAASLAHGVSVIDNAAIEPEVTQLALVLQDAGCNIKGIGTKQLIVQGSQGKQLNFKPFSIIPDRIEAGTFLCAAAISNAELKLEKVEPLHIQAVLSKLHEMNFKTTSTKDTVTIYPTDKIKPVNITTREYPYFPTDMQAQFLALATQADGTSVIEEKLFENRFMHVSELLRLGANITLDGRTATIKGPSKLNGADLMATDLRASSALVIAAFVAKGVSNIHRIYHLDRGYENIEEKFKKIGGTITRLEE
jgi:UDP-N-acetylglucosamine 1-carboxyvinyltransferase